MSRSRRSTKTFAASISAPTVGTPPELFPIGWMGVDGVHYGYVVHAPELERDDSPIGELCPMDSDVVFLVGADAATAFENLISTNLAQWTGEPAGDLDPDDVLLRDPEELASYQARISLISTALGISPEASKAVHRYGSDGEGFPVMPEAPDGWKHVPSSDGIGVLAPHRFFKPREFAHLEPFGDPAAFLSEGTKALAEDLPATALLHLREGYWHHGVDPELGPRLAAAMSECYAALGRPMLAEVLDAEVQKRQERGRSALK